MENYQKQLKHLPIKIFFFVLVLLFANSCKRSTDFDESESPDKQWLIKKADGSIPVFSTAEELNEHLRWIARGLAQWRKPGALVRGIDTLLNSARKIAYHV